VGWQDGKPIDAQPIETISPREAALRQQTGYTAGGQPAPPVAMVDTQAGSAPAQPAWMSGKPYVPPAKPDVPPAKTPATPGVQPSTGLGAAGDVTGAFLRGLLTLPANAAHAGLYFARAWSGNDDPSATPDPHALQTLTSMSQPTPQQGATLANIGESIPGLGHYISNVVHSPTPIGLAAQGASALAEHAKNPNTGYPGLDNLIKNTFGTVNAAANIAPMLGGPVKAAGAIDSTLDAASAAKAAETASPAGQLGLRTTAPHPIAAIAAGPSAAPALDTQNQAVASTILGADAGVPHGVPVTPSALSDARAAPGNVLDQAAATIPPGPLSAGAQAKVAAARGPSTITKPTPNVAGQINDLESSLLDPNGQFTGDQIRATRNSLSSDASAGRDSPDADTRAIATYKGRLVDALDQHVADTMPADGPVSPDMVQNARSTLAKNYQLQDLLGKGGDINLQQLAKLHRDSPNLLTGNTRTVAQFASDHPEVTGGISDADRIAPPGLLRDVSGVNPFKPVSSFSQALFGRAARNTLTGPPGASLAAAQQAPVAGLAGEFDARPPPAGPTGPPPAPAAGPIAAPGASPSGGGLLSLADDLAGPAGNSAPKTPPAKKKRTLADDLE